MGTTRGDGSWLQRTGRGCVAIGMIVAVTGFATTAASAPPGQGNNGTIKVDEQGLENGPGAPNSNDPHIDCVGRIEWYGFDPGAQEADVLFEVQAPTSNTGAPGADTDQAYENVRIVDGDGPGGTSLDGTLDFDLSDLLAFYTPHPQQGFHVKVTVHTTFAQGESDVKHKVFWVGPCPVAPPNPTFGSLSVDKAVTGNDPQDPAVLFSFTVGCTHNGQPVDLDGGSPGTQASFTLTAAQAAQVLSSIPTGAVCSVSETNAQGADATSMTVDGGAPTAGTTVSGIVIGNGTTVAVVASNTFNTSGGVGPVVVIPPLVTPPVVTTPEVLPEVIVPPVTPPVVAPEVVALPAGPTEVEGAVIPRQLPRTGSTPVPLVQIGVGLMLLGAGALLFGRERSVLA